MDNKIFIVIIIIVGIILAVNSFQHNKTKEAEHVIHAVIHSVEELK